MGAEAIKPRIVLVPFPAQGHLTPMLHLAQALQSHNLLPTLAVPDYIHRKITNNPNNHLYSSIEFVPLPSAAEGDGTDEPKDFKSIVSAMEDHMPGRLEEILRGYRDVACVVVDLVSSWAVPVASRCGATVVGFWPAMMACYKIVSVIPTLVQKRIISECGLPLCDETAEFLTELNQTIQLPVNITTQDLPWLVGDSDSCKLRFRFWLKIIDRSRSLKFILNNSFPAENGNTWEPLQNATKSSLQVLQVGPLLKYKNSKCANPTMWEIDSTCIKWLDSQREKSVIYVSFGSWVGPIGPDKIKELAFGLVSSGKPFLWVLKKDKAWQCGLPEGFMDRIKGRGKIVEWAPQEEVLKHKSIGLYLTHCGWNSTMEGIQHAKPLLCYPILADQFINCSYIVNVWGIGIKLDRIEQNVVRGYIEKGMEGKEGEEMLRKVIELRRNVIEGSASEKARSNLRTFVNSLQREACI